MAYKRIARAASLIRTRLSNAQAIKGRRTAAGGISPTVARLAKATFFHSPEAKYLHDVYEPLDPPMRRLSPSRM